MIKTICLCDRCGKEFPQDKSTKIYFRKGNEIQEQDFLSLVKKIFPEKIRDFCPECICEIKEFIEKAEGTMVLKQKRHFFRNLRGGFNGNGEN